MATCNSAQATKIYLKRVLETIARLNVCLPEESGVQAISANLVNLCSTFEGAQSVLDLQLKAALCWLSSGGSTTNCVRPDPNCDFFTVLIDNGSGEFGDLNIWDCWAKGLLFDDLTHCFGNMSFSQDGTMDTSGMPFLTFISAPLLTAIDGSISTVNSKALLSVSLPELVSVGGFCNIGSSANQAETIIPKLRTVGGYLDIGGVDNEETNIDALESVGGDANLGSTEVISAPSLHTVGGNITLGLGPTTTTVSLPALANFAGDFNAHGSALNVDSVNGILVQLDSISPALTGVTIDLAGGSSAAPTGAGAAAAANLAVLNTVLHN